jgi:hypothetical protein
MQTTAKALLWKSFIDSVSLEGCEYCHRPPLKAATPTPAESRRIHCTTGRGIEVFIDGLGGCMFRVDTRRSMEVRRNNRRQALVALHLPPRVAETFRNAPLRRNAVAHVVALLVAAGPGFVAGADDDAVDGAIGPDYRPPRSTEQR